MSHRAAQKRRLITEDLEILCLKYGIEEVLNVANDMRWDRITDRLQKAVRKAWRESFTRWLRRNGFDPEEIGELRQRPSWSSCPWRGSEDPSGTTRGRPGR